MRTRWLGRENRIGADQAAEMDYRELGFTIASRLARQVSFTVSIRQCGTGSLGTSGRPGKVVDERTAVCVHGYSLTVERVRLSSSTRGRNARRTLCRRGRGSEDKVASGKTRAALSRPGGGGSEPGGKEKVYSSDLPPRSGAGRANLG